MTNFTSDMWCTRCEVISPHHVCFIQLYGTTREDMYVEIEHLCLNEVGKGYCLLTRRDMLTVRDYNFLLSMGKEDYPQEFSQGGGK